MPRYPRGARRPRKPFKGDFSIPGVVGEPSLSDTLDIHKTAQVSYAQINAYKNIKNPTSAEVAFSDILKKLKISFQAQYPISGRYILDFYLRDYNLGIEIDGSQHKNKEVRKKDICKVIEAKKNGIKVIRYRNKTVLNNKSFVKNDILKKIKPEGKSNSLYFNDYDTALYNLKSYKGGILRRASDGAWEIST
jgi:very-short-patch-repair endonuclease